MPHDRHETLSGDQIRFVFNFPTEKRFLKYFFLSEKSFSLFQDNCCLGSIFCPVVTYGTPFMPLFFFFLNFFFIFLFFYFFFKQNFFFFKKIFLLLNFFFFDSRKLENVISANTPSTELIHNVEMSLAISSAKPACNVCRRSQFFHARFIVLI